MSERESNVAGKIVLGLGVIIGLWAVAALIGGLNQAGSIGELARQYLVATEMMITPLHIPFDSFTHIKGIEYLIYVVIIVAFSEVYVYVNKLKKRKIRR